MGLVAAQGEMIIFMEYCQSGTIEEMARLGLQEAQIRRYTKGMLLAIHELHEHRIVHRDIKGLLLLFLWLTLFFLFFG